jgi:uncharacterized protein (TIGR00369 family)
MTDAPTANRLDQLLEVFESIPHCRELGIKVVEFEPGSGTIRLDYQQRLVGNVEFGFVHGGVITTVLDTVAGLAAFSTVGKGISVATLDLRIDYLKPATPEMPIFGYAECYKTTRNVAFARGYAHHGDATDLIANCAATFMLSLAGNSVDKKEG